MHVVASEGVCEVSGGHGGGAFKRKGACYFGVLPGAPCGGALRLLFGTTKLKRI